MTTSSNNTNNNLPPRPFGGNAANNGTQNKPTPPPSRFGTPPQQATNNSSASRFASRFGSGTRPNGREEVLWTVAPLQTEAVRISLEGLGDPFHRLLGMPLNAEFSKPAKVLEALSKDEDLVNRLSEVLNEAWANYEFRGAAMLYPWDDGVRKAYTQPLQPTPPPAPSQKNEGKSDESEDDVSTPDWLQAPVQKSGTYLRAIDVAFALNILARSRANLVVSNTPLALESGFLDQVLICDDPRIVRLARATGCIEETW